MTRTNSSPPTRASTSPLRTASVHAVASSVSSRSPLAWPRMSLTCLSPSTSNDREAERTAGAMRAGDLAVERRTQAGAVEQPVMSSATAEPLQLPVQTVQHLGGDDEGDDDDRPRENRVGSSRVNQARVNRASRTATWARARAKGHEVRRVDADERQVEGGDDSTGERSPPRARDTRSAGRRAPMSTCAGASGGVVAREPEQRTDSEPRKPTEANSRVGLRGPSGRPPRAGRRRRRARTAAPASGWPSASLRSTRRPHADTRWWVLGFGGTRPWPYRQLPRPPFSRCAR